MYTARPDIKQVSDLEGKTLGIGSLGSVLHQMTVRLLQKKGVKVDTIKFRNVGSNAEVLKAVSAKTVDAGLSDVEVFDQQAKFGIHVLPDGLLWKEIPEYTNQGTYASDAAIRSNRDTLVRVLAAYVKAYRFVSGPDSRAAFLVARKKLTGISDPTQAITQWNWIQQNQPYATGLVLPDERINIVQRMNVEFKAQGSLLPMASLADMSLARDALKLLKAYQRMDVEALAGLRVRPEVEAEVESAMRAFLSYTLDRSPKSLAFLDEVRAAERSRVVTT
jgi:NitT/TauT family transport system substrate-binding protein